MTLNNPRQGPNWLGEYQISGLPWVTSSNATSGVATEIDFPFITSGIRVCVTGSNVRVGFTANGVLGSHYMTATPTVPVDIKCRVQSIFLTSVASTGSYELFASLTTIPQYNFVVLTGSAGLVPTTGSFGYSGSFDGLG